MILYVAGAAHFSVFKALSNVASLCPRGLMDKAPDSGTGLEGSSPPWANLFSFQIYSFEHVKDEFSSIRITFTVLG